MGIFKGKQMNSLKDLLLIQLRDLYDAETQLVKALPKLASAAASPELKQAFEHHLSETNTHVQRLEQMFQSLGEKASGESCAAMKGLISEGEEMIEAEGDASVKDAALIAAAQRVEHYEIAGYGSARTFAQQLGHPALADLLQQTLDEEGEADKKLTSIATSSVNTSAATAASAA